MSIDTYLIIHHSYCIHFSNTISTQFSQWFTAQSSFLLYPLCRESARVTVVLLITSPSTLYSITNFAICSSHEGCYEFTFKGYLSDHESNQVIISIEVEDVEEVCLSIDKSSNNGNHSKTILFLKSCCSHLIRTTDIQHHEVGIWTTTLNAQKVIIDWILTTFVIG